MLPAMLHSERKLPIWSSEVLTENGQRFVTFVPSALFFLQDRGKQIISLDCLRTQWLLIVTRSRFVYIEFGAHWISSTPYTAYDIEIMQIESSQTIILYNVFRCRMLQSTQGPISKNLFGLVTSRGCLSHYLACM